MFEPRRSASALVIVLTMTSVAAASIGGAVAATYQNPAAGADPIRGTGTYRAFHEKEGIQRIIDDFVPRVVADRRIGKFFAGVNLVRLNHELVDQVCYLTGGPCAYTGRDMREAHAKMALDNGDFNSLAEDLQISMNKEKVSFRAQNRLLAKLAPMQHVIVTRK